MNRRCFGLTGSRHFCNRRGDWLFFCKDHNTQWLWGLAFLIFTVGGGTASIHGELPNINFGADSVEVKGENLIAKMLNKAKLEGVYHTNPGSEFVVAKVVIRSDVTANIKDFPNHFLFTSVSPFRAVKMENTFSAGDCRFLGASEYYNSSSNMTNINIQTISCIDNSGYAYDLNAKVMGLSRLGYVSSVENISNEGVLVEEEDKMYSLPAGKNVYVKFDSPILLLNRKGKSAMRW